MVRSASLASALLVFAALSLPACSDDGTGAQVDDLTNTEKATGKSQKWIYEGMLPALQGSSIFVSLKSHTARITGLLPEAHTGPLPFYALSKVLDTGRTQVTVVYPVATGKVDPTTGLPPAGPGVYPRLYATPFTPTNDKAAWGGFPFMKYNATRGLAFHGPITSVWDAQMGDYEWRLTRGPVSHGCNRMQGEHVVELAHLLGIDMSKPHAANESLTLKVKVTVSTEFDLFDGKYIDVDYPALASVARPKKDVLMASTWDSNDFPRWVCAYDKARPLDGTHCEIAGENRRDPETGELLVQPSDEPWIGTSCAGDATCDFGASGKKAFCLKSGEQGYCTVACEGYCADKEGASKTFCAVSNGAGRCMAKAGPENADCADIPGTHITLKPRFVGKSGAPAAEASVCSF